MKILKILSVLIFGAVLLGLTAASYAHTGGLAKDGCHTDKTSGERHFHASNTRIRMGVCKKLGQEYWKIPDELITTEIVEKEIWKDPDPVLKQERDEAVRNAEHSRQRMYEAESEKSKAINRMIKAENAATTAETERRSYEKKMRDMQDGTAVCLQERNDAQATLVKDPWGDKWERKRLESLLDCLRIGE